MKQLFCVAILILISACASAPYSKVDGGSSEHIDRHNVNVIIAGLDEKQFVIDKQILKLEPGLHELKLYSTRANFKGRITSKTFELDAKPCIKYFLAARHDSEVDFDSWEVIILREEPITYCENLSEIQNE